MSSVREEVVPFSTFWGNLKWLFTEKLRSERSSGRTPIPVAKVSTIAEAMQNPRKGSVVDWPYEPMLQPGPLRFQNPEVFLPSGAILDRSSTPDKAPYMTELLNRHRSEFFAVAMGYLKSSCVFGDYHEYGCYSATTFRMALTNACLFELDKHDPEMRFHAFDSFEGLPEVSPDLAHGSNWVKGSMAFGENEFRECISRHGVFVDRVCTHRGFFDRSLTPELQAELLGTERRIAFVNVDCDLYESATDVFRFIAPLLQTGTIIYMDDWYCGYHGAQDRGIPRAFFEFCEKYEVRADRFRDCGWWGRSYTVIEPGNLVHAEA